MWTASTYVTAIPLGRRLPGASSNLPGRQDPDTIPKRRRARARRTSRRPYSVLLPVGFAVPPALPPARCALTAPFHPYRGKTLRAAAVCSLWHYPWARTRRTLSGTACPWSPDFPPRQPFGFAGAAVRPTDRDRHGGARCRRQVSRRVKVFSLKKRRPAWRCEPAPQWFGCGRDGRAGRAMYCGLMGRRCRRPARGGSGAEKQ
jgi:hypothetical protein